MAASAKLGMRVCYVKDNIEYVGWVISYNKTTQLYRVSLYATGEVIEAKTGELTQLNIDVD